MAKSSSDLVQQYQSDHDLLVELRTEFKGLRDDIKALTDSTGKIVDDHEKRIRFLERWVWGAIAVLAVSEAAITIWSNLH